MPRTAIPIYATQMRLYHRQVQQIQLRLQPHLPTSNVQPVVIIAD